MQSETHKKDTLNTISTDDFGPYIPSEKPGYNSKLNITLIVAGMTLFLIGIIYGYEYSNDLFKQYLRSKVIFSDSFISKLMMLFLPLQALIGGLAITYFSATKYKASQQYQKNINLHPSKPWLWRDDWKRSLINCETKSIFWLALPILLIGVSILLMPVVPSVLAIIFYRGEGVAVAFTIAIWYIVPMVWIIYYLIKQTKVYLNPYQTQGTATLELNSNPVILGQSFESVVHGFSELVDHENIQAKLQCLLTDHNKSEIAFSKHKEISIARDEQDLEARIPITFDIPNNMPPTHNGKRYKCTWELSINSYNEGGRHKVSFLVPVFTHADD